MSDNIKEIEKYIDNLMSEEETLLFTERLEKDSDLKKDFLLIQDINKNLKARIMAEEAETDPELEAIKNEVETDIDDFFSKEKDKQILSELAEIFPKKAEKTKLLNTEDEKEQKKPYLNISLHTKTKRRAIKGKRRLYIWTASTAAAVLLLIIANNIFFSVPKSERVFAEYHKQRFNLMEIQNRNSEQSLVADFSSAMILYKEDDFDGSARLFNKISENNEKIPEAVYNEAVSAFEAGDFEKSITIFSKLIADYNTYDLEAQWASALAYIKLNDYQKALPLLRSLAQQKSIYQPKAKDIIDRIDD